MLYINYSTANLGYPVLFKYAYLNSPIVSVDSPVPKFSQREKTG
jgi:hypothetical protein